MLGVNIIMSFILGFGIVFLVLKINQRNGFKKVPYLIVYINPLTDSTITKIKWFMVPDPLGNIKKQVKYECPEGWHWKRQPVSKSMAKRIETQQKELV